MVCQKKKKETRNQGELTPRQLNPPLLVESFMDKAMAAKQKGD
jgi:hypothetical protein